MNEEIIHRLFQVFLYTGGIVSFWQITKHMPKVFFNLLEYIIAIPLYSSWIIPIAGLIEYIFLKPTVIYMRYNEMFQIQKLQCPPVRVFG